MSGATPQSFASITVGSASYRVCVPHGERDYIQHGLLESGRPYEESMLEAMAAKLSSGDLVLDVGANIGNHTLYLAVAAGARVIAYEPNPELVAGLRHSIDENGLMGQVSVREVGVHAKPGFGTMSGLNPSNLGAQSITVSRAKGDFDVVTLDAERIPGKVAAIKIDVEGAELAVLQGARELLARDHPRLYVECASVESFRAVSEMLAEIGYSLRGTYNLTPTHVFAASSGTPEEREVSDALVVATAEIYALKAANRARQAEIAALKAAIAPKESDASNADT